MVASLVGVHELMVLFGVGVLVVLAARLRSGIAKDGRPKGRKSPKAILNRSRKGVKRESKFQNDSKRFPRFSSVANGFHLCRWRCIPQAGFVIVGVCAFSIGGVLYGSGYAAGVSAAPIWFCAWDGFRNHSSLMRLQSDR